MRTSPLTTALLLVGLLAAVGCSATPEEQARQAILESGGELRTDSQGNIISVDLSDSAAGDNILAVVGIFPTVQTINCTNAQRITGSGMGTLGGLQHLETLYLVNTSLDDAGLAHVGHLRSLKTLHLGRTHISDAGLKALEPLKNLQTLSLGNTGISDAGLVELRNVRSLSTIILRDTRTTPRGIQELQRMLPDARIVD